MRNKFVICILSLLSLHCITYTSDNTATKRPSYAILGIPNEGRFGDQLLCYCRAKWLSYKFNMPLLYMPFNYSDQLMLHEQETMYTQQYDQLFSNNIHLPNHFISELIPENNTLYTCDWNINAHTNWNDNNFLEQLKNSIYPRYTLNKTVIPDGYISIAVHVRNGGDFQSDAEKYEQQPLRFASEEFFIDQIKRIADMFPQQKLYVHIFTDHQEPIILKKIFEKNLNNPCIIFGCREQNNHHSSNVLEDFFSMMDFHCLIRPESNFSKIVQYLGNNKIVIYPKSYKTTHDGKKIINVINIKTRNRVGDHWKTKKITIG